MDRPTTAPAADGPEDGAAAVVLAVRGVAEEDRPRERLARLGPDALAAAELLAVILGTGTRGRTATEVAQCLLEDSGGLRRLSSRTMAEIAGAPGVGTARAARIMAAFAIGRQLGQLRIPPGARFRSGADIFRHYHIRLRDLRKEQFWKRVLIPLS